MRKHNELSPPNLQASMEILTLFESEKPSLFKDEDWSIKKIRRPFIFWLTSLSEEEKNKISKNKD